MLTQLMRRPCGIRGKVVKPFLKITVSPSFLLMATPTLVPLNPILYLQTPSLCHPPTAFLTPSEQVPSAAHRFPSLSPQSHPCGKTPAPLLPPHPLTPHLQLCLLVSCSPCYMSPQQDLSFKALYPFPFLSHFFTSNQKQNSCGPSEHAWALAYKGPSGLTVLCGYPHVCNTSKVPGCRSLPFSEENPQGKILCVSTHTITADSQ